MFPTFALYLLAFALAVLAPVVAIASLVLTATPRWRALGLWSLAIAFATGVTCFVLWLGVYLVFAKTSVWDWFFFSIVFGAAFCAGGLAVFVWHAVRRVLSNPTIERDAPQAGRPSL